MPWILENGFGDMPIEFSLFWRFHDISQPLATCFYVNNYLPSMPVGMGIGKSIVFEVENQKIKVKTLKKIRFHIKYESYEFKLVHGC